MTIEQKRRELFEDVARKQGYDLIRYGSSDYEFSATRRAWSFFNAVLDAVVLPAREDDADGDRFAQGFNHALEEIESTGLGLKVKA